jgi:hypothetical protein
VVLAPFMALGAATPACAGEWVLVGSEGQRWEPAIDALRKRREPQALADLDMVYAGNHALGTSLSDLSWAWFWQDGARPAYSTHKTAEELERRRQQALALLANTGRQVAQRAGTLQQGLQALDQELAFQSNLARHFQTKPEAQHRDFKGMAGWTEARLVAFWGPPSRIDDNPQERHLLYLAEDDRSKSFAVRDGGGNEVAAAHYGEWRQCQLELVLRPGGGKPGLRLVDYRLLGQHCKASTVGTLVQ